MSDGAVPKSTVGTLGKGALLILVGQLVSQLAYLVIRIALIRQLSLDQYGTLVFGTSLFSLLLVVLGLGVPTLAARQIAANSLRAERRTVLRQSLVATALASTLGTIILWFVAPDFATALSNSELVWTIQALSLANVANLFAALIAAYFQGVEDALPQVLFVVAGYPVFVMVTILVTSSLGAGFRGAVLGYVLGAALSLTATVGYFLLRRTRILGPERAEKVQKGAETHGYRSALTFVWAALPIGLALAGSGLVGNVDTVVLGFFRPADVIGAYSASLGLGRLASIALTAVSFMMVPVASRLLSRGQSLQLARIYAVMTKWALVVPAAAVDAVIAFPNQSLHLFYGSVASTPEYIQGEPALEIVVGATFIAGMLGPSTALIMGAIRYRPLVIGSLLCVGLDFFGTLALAPDFGMTGAAIAASCAIVALPAVCAASSLKGFGVYSVRREVLTPALASTLPLLLVFLVLRLCLGWLPNDVELIALAALSIVVYLVSVPITTNIGPEDSELLAMIESSLGFRLPGARWLGRFAAERRRGRS